MSTAEWKGFALDDALARALLTALEGASGAAQTAWEYELPVPAGRSGLRAAHAAAVREQAVREDAPRARADALRREAPARAGRGAAESAWTGAEVRRSMKTGSAAEDGGAAQAPGASVTGNAQADARRLSQCFERDARRYG